MVAQGAASTARGRAPLKARHAAGVIGGFVALTAILTFPISLFPASRAVDLGADTRLFLWTLGWDVHALSQNPFSLFQANIFFPQMDTLAYSEHLLGNALLAAPWLAATDNLVLGMNAVVLISCVGAGAGTYFLARSIGIGAPGALVAGVVFAFAPPRFFRLGQLHLANVMWMPLCLAFLHRYVKGGRRRDLVLACVFFTLQALSGGQAGLFLLLASVGWLVYAGACGILTGPRTRLFLDLGMATALLVVLNGPFLLPYLRVQREAGLRRSLDEAREWAPNAASFLAAPTHTQRALLSLHPALERHVLGVARAYLFPGFLTLLLAASALRRSHELAPHRKRPPPPTLPRWVTVLNGAIVAATLVVLLLWASGGVRWQLGGVTLSARGTGRALLVLGLLMALRLVAVRRVPFRFTDAFIRARDRTRDQLQARTGLEAGYYLLLVVVSLWISLGPPFGLYSALHRMVPGFDFIRVPSRFTILTVLGLAVLAGAGLDRWLRDVRSNRRRWWTAAATAVLILEFAAFPLDARPYSIEIPAVDRWIAEKARTEGPFALVELPVPDPRDTARSARWQSIYMIHSTAHWQRIVNGYSGFAPAEQDALFRRLANFPDDASVSAMERLGVRYAVLHRDGYRDAEWDDLQAKLDAFGKRLRLEIREEGDAVYSFTRRTETRSDRGS